MSKIFLSHISEEAPIAIVLKDWIESSFAGQCEVFVSSDKSSNPPGSRWLDLVDTALSDSKAFIVLCSPNSLHRPWINFETGCGWIKRVPIIPICHSGQEAGNLPMPISLFQGVELESSDFIEVLLKQGNRIKIDKLNASNEMQNAAFSPKKLHFECLQQLALHVRSPCLLKSLADCLVIKKLPRVAKDEMLKDIQQAQREIAALFVEMSSKEASTPNSALVLAEEEIALLVLIGKLSQRSNNSRAWIEKIRSESSLSLVKLQFYLHSLTEKKLIRNHSDYYYLTQPGRKLLIDHNLVD